MAQTQIYSPEAVENFATAFPRRNDASFAWGNAVSYYLNLPQLRAFWPFSSVSGVGQLIDLSGQNRFLSPTGSPTYGVYGLQPYGILDGVTQYYSRPDEVGLDITGALTVGGWFRATSASNYALITKYNTTGNQRSYLLGKSATSGQFSISTDGITASTVTGGTWSNNVWYFVAGRFVPSTSVDVFLNADKYSNIVGIPATIFNSTAELNIGAYNTGATARLSGNAALCFLCAEAISDAQIKALYWLTKPLFFGT